jgi:hypothetical protein
MFEVVWFASFTLLHRLPRISPTPPSRLINFYAIIGVKSASLHDYRALRKLLCGTSTQEPPTSFASNLESQPILTRRLLF